MRCHHLLLAALLGMGSASAQNLGEIRGVIVDDKKMPLPGATVIATAADQEWATAADENGKFVLKPLPPGTYSVQVSFIGFHPIDLAGVEVTADRATYLNGLSMTDVAQLPEARIVGRRPYKRPLIEIDDPSRQTLLASEFKKDPNIKSPVQFIAKSFAGITPAPNGDGLYFRGSRTENMVSYIDGVKVSGAVPRVPPSAISSISVYTGGLPARYGDVTGGVIVIETKTYGEMFEEARALELRREREEQPTEQPE